MLLSNLLKSAAVLSLVFALSSATARAANDLTYSLTLTPFTFTGNGTQGGTGTLVVAGPNTGSGLTFVEFFPIFPFPPGNLESLGFTLGSDTFDLSDADFLTDPNGHLAANGNLTALNYSDSPGFSSPGLLVGSGVSDGDRSCPSGDICYLFTPGSTFQIESFDSNYNDNNYNNGYCERDCDNDPTFGVLTSSTTLPTPEPASLVLFGSILSVVSFSLRKRLSKK